LFARLELPATTMKTGSSMPGAIVVENATGHVLRVTGCLSVFTVALGNDRVRASVAWPECLQRFTIPKGASSYPITVVARYRSCPPPRCDGRRPPPLPAGRYRVVVFRASSSLPPVAPVAMVVTR
jgi:hypothetical protein